MFELVKEDRSMELADYIVYRGKDNKRKRKDFCRYENPEEKHQVQNLHQRIAERYLPYDYNFVKFFTEKESEGRWLIWEMEFMINDKPKKVYFAFLKVGDRYLLGDID